MLSKLKDYARGVVETKAKEEAGRVLIRFSTLFSHDSDSMPRLWTGKERHQSNYKNSTFIFSQNYSSVMAAIRLEEETDNIGNTLALALIESKSGGAANKSITSSDPLASSSWDEEASKREITIGYRLHGQLLPWNPLYLGVIFVAYLLLKALWVQLDISGEFRNGARYKRTVSVVNALSHCESDHGTLSLEAVLRAPLCFGSELEAKHAREGFTLAGRSRRNRKSTAILRMQQRPPLLAATAPSSTSSNSSQQQRPPLLAATSQQQRPPLVAATAPSSRRSALGSLR
nr:protein ROOT HAIR DEFECTIVE 3-like [Ipomoea batatas]